LTAPRILRPKPLTATAFARYGDVIEADDAKRRLINEGRTIRYHDLARIDTSGDEGRVCVSIFRSTPPAYPLTLRVMENHPVASQAHIPLSGRPFLVVVAPRGRFDAGALEAFIAGPSQGVNYHKGVWHHYNLALGGVSDFLVIDREGRGDNLEEVTLDPAHPIVLSPEAV
jgi:ureidoglycolate lyase